MRQLPSSRSVATQLVVFGVRSQVRQWRRTGASASRPRTPSTHSNFVPTRNATRKNAGANMLKGCRRTVPAEGFAFHSTHLAEGRHRWRVAVVGRSGSQLCRLPLPNANRSLRICFGVLLMKVIFQSRTRSAIKRGTARPGERHRLRGLRGKLPRGARIARRNVDSAAEAKATVINDADAATGSEC